MKIVFFDLETTGLDTKKDRIIEIGLVKFGPEGTDHLHFKINPGIPITTEATAVHGITNEMLEGCPSFKAVMQEIILFIEDLPIAGFNSNAFDVPFLYNEFARNGYNWDWKKHRFIDVGNIFKNKEKRTLAAASKFYLGKEHEDAHSAIGDVLVTIEVLEAMIKRYDLSTDIDALEKESLLGNSGQPADINRYFAYNEAGILVINFGKHRGNPAMNHIDYLSWMWKQDFPADTKAIIEDLIF